mmetsp:Transcript_63818/g.152211  ORF Transcript_63818/g.152211 Transcript_63818/m.152211 type:complete len:340 (-) Transcript_63818:43-1062(-)
MASEHASGQVRDQLRAVGSHIVGIRSSTETVQATASSELAVRRRRRRGVRALAAVCALGTAIHLWRRTTSSPSRVWTFADVGILQPLRFFGMLQPSEHLCAVEGLRCGCVGIATLHGPFAQTVERRVNHSISCQPDFFGADPQPHSPKYCTCRPGPDWPVEVVEGLRSMFSRHLSPRIEIGHAGAGCGSEDDGRWTPCAVMSTKPEGDFVPESRLTSVQPDLFEDIALRKLDKCFHLAGPQRSLRVLGIWKATALNAMEPIQSSQAPVCALAYSPPEGGAVWQRRDSIFCPTEPPHCLEEDCECADDTMRPIDIHADQEGLPACWACRHQISAPRAEAE